MKHICRIDENFSPVDMRGQGDMAAYAERVRGCCFDIACDDLGISEKSFTALDRLEGILYGIIDAQSNEATTIVSNCMQRRMRERYCAEAVYHALLQDKLRGLAQRPWAMGGFAIEKEK